MIYKEMLENIRNELCSRRDDLLQELRQLPDGRLLCTDDGKHKRYYQRLKVEGRRKKERRYGIKKKPAVLHGLVRKEYITKALPVLEKNIETIDTALRWFRLSDENSVMENYLKKYPEVR